MRHSQLCILFGFVLSLSLIVGCGSSDSKPVADTDEIQQYLADNPDQDTDDLEDDDTEEDEELTD